MRQIKSIIILLLLSVVAPLATLADSFKVTPVDLVQGETTTLQFVLENSQEFYGFQAEVKLPTGLNPVKSGDKGDVDFILSNRADGGEYHLNSNTRSNGNLIIGAFSANHKPFMENNGALLDLKVSVAENFEGGTIEISNIYFINSENQDVEFTSTSAKIGVAVTGVTLDKTTLNMTEGDNATLTATITPATATDKPVTWTSSNEAIATVDATGKVTAKAIGEATITATCGAVEATCKVTVIPTPVENITLSNTALTLTEGDKAALTATVVPANATDKTVTWTSSDESVATVSEAGEVTAVKAGTATITATSSNGKTAACNVTVSANIISVTGITISKTELDLTEGDKATLTVTITPENATDKTVTWTSSDELVATVSAAGEVTAVKAGTVTITAASSNGKTVTCTVTVAAKIIPATGVTLSNTTSELKVGETVNLTATVTPEDATDKTIVWTSSDEAIATVDATGKVTAKAIGEATVTATCGAAKATCKVTVVPTPVESIKLSNTALTLTEGDKATLTATVAPENATDKTITWSSSDESIAMVSAAGEVTAVKAGTATITATASGKTATCVVTVSAKVIEATEITLSASTAELKVGETVTLTARVAPENATDKTVTWTSSDEAVATVDANGKVFAVALGEATITVACGNAKATCKVKVVEPFEVTASWWHQWDGFGADAKILEETEKIFTSNLGVAQEQGSHIIGDPGCSGACYADLTEYGGIEGTGTPGITVRLYINRQSMDDKTGDALDIKVDIKEDGTYRYDFSELPGNPSYVHLNFVKTAAGWQGGKWPEGLEKAVVETMKVFPKPSAEDLAKKNLTEVIDNASHYDGFAKTEDSFKNLTDAIDAGNALLDNATATAAEMNKAITAIQTAISGFKYLSGYSALPSDIFKQYADVSNPGEGKAIACNNIICTTADTPYGDGSVGYLNWADLTDYDELIVTYVGDKKPRIMMNRQEHGRNEIEEGVYVGLMLEMKDGNGHQSTEKYLTPTDNGCIINLKNIVDDYGYARLNAIKYPYGESGTVTGMYLYKDPNAAKQFDLTFDIDDVNHVVVKVNDETKDVASNGVLKVADRAKLSITPATDYIMTSVTANGEPVELKNGMLTKTIVKNITYKITTDDADPLAQPKEKLTEIIEDAKLYDKTAKTEDSFNALTEAIADAEAELVNEKADAASLQSAGDAITAAINGLTIDTAAGYSKLTTGMYKCHDSLENPVETEDDPGCANGLMTATELPYGNKNNDILKWADLFDYDKLIITTDGKFGPHIFMNRLDANGQQAGTMEESKMIDINPNTAEAWSSKYLTVENNEYNEIQGKKYTIDLKQILADYGFVRLHSIQSNTYERSIFVTGMYLKKDQATNVDLTFDVDDPDQVVIKVDNEVITDLKVGENKKEVAFRGKLSIAPADGFAIKSLTADGVTVDLTEEGEYTTTILNDVSYKIVTFDPNAKESIKLNFNVDDASHVVVTAGGTVIEDFGNDVEVEENTVLSIVAAEGYKLESVNANGVPVEITDNKYEVTLDEESDRNISYVITTVDVFEQSKEDLSAKITTAKLYDAYAKTEESFAALQIAIESAEAVLKENPTAETVAAADKAIDDAINGLKLAEGYDYLTPEMFKGYASVEEPGEGEAIGCAYELFKAVSTPYGDGNVSEKNWADLAAYDKLVVKMGDTKTPRVMMNRMEATGNDADTKEDSKMLDMSPGNSRWSTTTYTTYDSEKNVFTVNLRKIVEDYGYARLNAIKYPWSQDGSANGFVTGLYLYTSTDDLEGPKEDLATAISNAKLYDSYAKTTESWNNLQTAIEEGEAKYAQERPTVESVESAIKKINDAIAGLKLQDGYVELTKEMFKRYKDVNNPGEGEATGCDYNLFEKNGNTYGDGANVGYLNWANLTGYDKLIIKASGNPRFCMNRQADGGQQKETMEESEMIDIEAGGKNWSTNRYLTSDGDVYTVDIAKIVDDYGFARLHAIKYPWGQDGIATFMYLYKDPNAAKEHKLTFDIDDPDHVVIEVNGEEIKDLKAGANEKNVADRAELTISPAEGFKLTSVTAGDDVYVKLINGILTKTIVKNISFEIATEDADPLAQPKKELTAAIESAKLYDSFAKTEKSFTALTDAIADAEKALEADDATEASLTTAGDNVNKAIGGLTLKEGYSKLTREMFKEYASVEEPGEGVETECAYDLFKTSRMPYGANNESLKWADLSKYDQLIVTTVGDGDLPRFCMNDEVSTKFEINPYNGTNEATEAYQTVEGNAYIIDLKKIVMDNEFAHLHSIQVNGWGTGALVNGMYLYKKPYVAATGIALDKTEITKVVYGEEVKLTATVDPVDATDPTLWSSSNEEVATVDEDGNVSVVGVGNATITVTCGEYSAECVFECYPQIGDANWDGTIDVTDAVDIVNYVVEKKNDIPENNVEEWTKFYVAGANVNNDEEGKITFADASAAVKLALDQPAASSTQNRVIAAYDNETQDALVIGGISAADGRIFVPVTLDNSMEYVALQADIILPEGMNVEVKEGSRIAGSHILATKKFADNHIRVALYNLGNTAFADNNAPIIEIFADGMISDNEEIEISNIIAADTDANRFVLASKAADTTGVDALGFDSNAPVKVYDLNGRYISDKVEGLEEGFYIIRQGNNAKKVRIR